VRGMLDSLGAPGDSPALAGDSASGWTRVAALDDLPNGAAKTAYVGGEQVAVFNVAGSVYAIEARCTHGNGPLIEGTFDGTTLTCPWHGSQFDIARDCDILRGPAVRPPRNYAVEVRDGAVYVSAAGEPATA